MVWACQEHFYEIDKHNDRACLFKGFKRGADIGIKMKCPHCKDELGEGDSYDLMDKHLNWCNSKEASKVRVEQDKEKYGYL